MNGGISGNYSLTQRQIQASAELSKVVPEFPLVVSDLISQMAIPDFSLATRQLELDSNDHAIANEANQQIINNIEFALTSPSTECEPHIKEKIFFNATDFVHSLGYYRYLLKPYLVQIVDDLQTREQQINLDSVALTDLNLCSPTHINLKGVSAKGASFHNIAMDSLNMECGDFTGARFVNVCLARANLAQAIFTDATLLNIWFEITAASELISNQSGMVQRRDSYWQQTILNTVTVQVETSCLAGRLVTAMPDMKAFTFPLPKLTVTARHPDIVFRVSSPSSCNLG